MLKRTPLKKTHGLNTLSPARVKQLNGEVPARIALAERCGGEGVIFEKIIEFKNGKTATLKTVVCVEGYCEICHKPSYCQNLHPHEVFYRSQGGKVSLDNSIMCHDWCHPKSEVKLEWLK